MSRPTTPGKSGPEDNDDNFLRRWSRRKSSAGKPAEEATSSAEDAGPAKEQAETGDEQPVLCDEDMPDIDSIDENSNIADFFSPGVSEALRRKALRKVFHGAAFNVRDGLDDYDLDYSKFEKLGDIVTADMRHRMQMEAERLAAAEGDAAADDAAPGPQGSDDQTKAVDAQEDDEGAGETAEADEDEAKRIAKDTSRSDGNVS